MSYYSGLGKIRARAEVPSCQVTNTGSDSLTTRPRACQAFVGFLSNLQILHLQAGLQIYSTFCFFKLSPHDVYLGKYNIEVRQSIWKTWHF